MNALERAIDAFERAVEEKAFEGTIPLYSNDPDEQRAINAERRRLRANYTKARRRLSEIGKPPA